MAAVRVRASQMGCRLFRNNNGAAWNPAGRFVRFGLGADIEGLASTDLVGIGPRGRFLAIECKRPGWKYQGDDRERRQLAFIVLTVLYGGIGGFVRSADEFEIIVRNYS